MKPLTPIQAPGLTTPVVRVSELRDAGVKKWRLYRVDRNAPMRGTRAAPNIDGATFEARVAAVRALLTEGQFISRRSAALLLGIPAPKPPRDQITTRPRMAVNGREWNGNRVVEVGAVRPCKPPERPEIIGHQLQPGVLASMPAAPDWLPTPADSWALLAAVATVDDLIVAGDHLISATRKSRGPGCSLEQLIDAVERFAGCVGVGRLREALPLIRHNVASPPETTTRLTIVRAGLPEPETNCEVSTPGRVLHTDLGYPRLRIAIEYDGAYHFENGATQAKFDNNRCERMRDAGWAVLQLNSLDLQNMGPFLSRLTRAIVRAEKMHG